MSEWRDKLYTEADNARLRAENAKFQAEIAELEGTIECLKGLAEANYERCDTCEAMLDCDECTRADASHKELRGLQAENKRMRDLVRDYERCTMHADCSRCEYDGKLSTHCPLSPCFPDVDELRELGIEVDE